MKDPNKPPPVVVLLRASTARKLLTLPETWKRGPRCSRCKAGTMVSPDHRRAILAGSVPVCLRCARVIAPGCGADLLHAHIRRVIEAETIKATPTN